ncbi:hypothetical protein K8R32_00975 [bacterium]|nr:hypothetical protein [bacterium]
MPRKIISKINKADIKLDKIKMDKKITRLRGVKDILFDEYRYFDLVINKATDLSTAYGFKMRNLVYLNWQPENILICFQSRCILLLTEEEIRLL